METEKKRLARYRRQARVRAKVEGSTSRPRLCVFRSLKHIYAQVIDDSGGNTLVSASTLDPDLKEEMSGRAKTGGAELVGSLVARRAMDKGIKLVVFDRSGYKYHGRIKAVAEAARQTGLKF